MSVAHHPQHPDIRDDMWIKIDEIIAANRNLPGSVIGVLRQCQDVVGYLPVALIDYISDGLNLSASEVFGVASFYSLFSFEPKGRHLIRVCMGTACYVKGIQETISRIENKYNLKAGRYDRGQTFFHGSRALSGRLRTRAGGGGGPGYLRRRESRKSHRNP